MGSGPLICLHLSGLVVPVRSSDGRTTAIDHIFNGFTKTGHFLKFHQKPIDFSPFLKGKERRIWDFVQKTRKVFPTLKIRTQRIFWYPKSSGIIPLDVWWFYIWFMVWHFLIAPKRKVSHNLAFVFGELVITNTLHSLWCSVETTIEEHQEVMWDINSQICNAFFSSVDDTISFWVEYDPSAYSCNMFNHTSPAMRLILLMVHKSG